MFEKSKTTLFLFYIFMTVALVYSYYDEYIIDIPSAALAIFLAFKLRDYMTEEAEKVKEEDAIRAMKLMLKSSLVYALLLGMFGFLYNMWGRSDLITALFERSKGSLGDYLIGNSIIFSVWFFVVDVFSEPTRKVYRKIMYAITKDPKYLEGEEEYD
jgi:hypothetical protein